METSRTPPKAYEDGKPSTRNSARVATALVVVSFLGGLALGAIAPSGTRPSLPAAVAQAPPGTARYELEIRAVDIPLAPDTLWHAWTFNGTVPGPGLTVFAGDTLLVTVKNRHTMVHSFHTHLAPYGLEHDGSQINTITGVGAGAMIPPGGDHTYEFHPTLPGIYYYHCHSADGGHTIADHIAQGLYGLLIVKARDEPPVRDEPLFMAERGFDVDGPNAPYFIMNGRGIPGGEHALEKIYAEKGVEGVVAEFGKSVPLVKAKVGETVRLSVVNIGDRIHSFHLHGHNMVSVDQMPGRIHPANVLQLVPGGADRILVTGTEPGVWLFHCHVVSHADGGMIGVFVLEKE